MSLKTWSLKVGDRVLSLRMLKDDAKHFQHYTLHKVLHAEQYMRERTGTIEPDGTTTDDHMSASFILFGAAFQLSEEGKAARLQFVAELPGTITREMIPAIEEKAQAFYEKWVSITDKRKTREAKEADAIEHAEIKAKFDAERAEKKTAFLAAWSSGEMATIPRGATYFEIEANYDDSDSMSDYFATASYGAPLFLAFAPGGPRREEAYRTAVACYPNLQALEWKMERHEYSMGRGTWLQSSQAGLTEGVKTYGGHINPPFVFEVRIASAREDMTLPAFIGRNPHGPSLLADPLSDGIEVRRNEMRNGIEIVFPSKPEEATREEMKAHGFRWSPRQGLWYTRFESGKWEYAQALAGKKEPEKVEAAQ